MKKSSLSLSSSDTSALYNAPGGSSADTAFAQSELGQKLLNTLSDPKASAANKAVAEQLLRNPVRATAWGIEELAAHAQTSAATLSRFARSTGFSGFAAMRDEMAQVLQSMLQPMEKLRDAVQPGAKQGAVTQSLEAGLNNARTAAQTVDEALLSRISARLATAGTVYVMGFGISSHLAAMLSLDLQPFCKTLINVVEFGGTEVAAGRLMNIDKNDVLIVLSFPRYARDAIQLTSYARDRGAHVVALTDAIVSPLVALADDVLLATAHHPVISSSSVAAVLLIEALVTSLMVSRKANVQQAGKLTEAIAGYLISPSSKKR
ncbi:MurR/RpiR family transcriptional regulator [Variovorax sp. PCZ-1]|uniref:MurR/RpiR family transcriptional regulator n=1 Tax=Variovorax sp. PCZ-1 TaxID=2835533 RepID=UPI001BCDA5B4|nr:MurR/RpiR family transcriptional regulator [Variovorax sp. PCZ-1]MBS7808784.1 MurR/RpiR family transcriptional regulator [Variovorax sp. PCZ-1]